MSGKGQKPPKNQDDSGTKKRHIAGVPIDSAIIVASITAIITAFAAITVAVINNRPTPPPTPPKTLIEELTIPGYDGDGVPYVIRYTGKYTFRYVGGAYAVHKLDNPGAKTWRSEIRVFLNQEVPWKNGEIERNKRLFYLGHQHPGYETEEEVKKDPDKKRHHVEYLNEGDKLYFIAVDDEGAYDQNRGQVTIEIQFSRIEQ